MVALRIASAIAAAAATPAAWGQAPSTNWHELPGSQPIPGGLALRPSLLSFYGPVTHQPSPVGNSTSGGVPGVLVPCSGSEAGWLGWLSLPGCGF